MTDPFKAWMAYQQVLLDGWSQAARLTWGMWQRCADAQWRLMSAAVQPPRRDQCSTEASFTDCYGRRAHDIDPERDV
jgi:hypothetical protein